MSIVSLSSSDGRFDISVAADDAELIASMLLLLEVPCHSEVRSIESVRTRVWGRPAPRVEAPRPVPVVLAS